MKSVVLIAVLNLVAATDLLALEETRAPRPVPQSAELDAGAEGAESLLYMRAVDVALAPTKATITIGKLSNARAEPSGPLKLELWATTRPPAYGEDIEARIVASGDLPFVLQGGEDRLNYTTGPLPFNPPTQGAFYLTLALLEYYADENDYFYADLFTLPGSRKFGPVIVVTGLPRGLFQRIGSGGAIDDFFVSNLGNAPANIQISQIGDFFAMTPTSFVLPAGARERVRLIASSRSEGFYKGEAIVSANGQQVYGVPIRLLAANPPSGDVRPRATASRVDVSGAANAQPRGEVTFTNSGSATLKGIPVSDAPWLIPDDGLVTIPPGGSATVSFICRREFRVDTSLPGVSASLSLAYLLGSGNSAAKSTFETPPTSFAGVVVTDTTQPDTSVGAIPPLAAGEVAVMIPGVLHVADGSRELVSDLSIVNGVLGTTVGDMRLYFSSASTSKSTPPSALAPSESLNLADVVTGYFGETGQVGTIQVRSNSLGSLTMAANVFDKANAAGTHGTAIPIFRSDRAVAPGQTMVLSGLRQDAGAETRIFLQEMSGAGPATASIDFYSGSGAKIGSITPPPVQPFGLTVLDAAVPAGAVSAVVTPASGRFAAYATPVDAASGDSWAVADWSRYFQHSGSEDSIIPVSGSIAGLNDSSFRTDVSVTNTGTTQGSVRLVYHPESGAAASDALDLAPNESTTLEDAVPSFFGVAGESVGWISVEPASGNFAVTSRIYTTAPGQSASFGTGVPTVSPSIGLRSGQSRTFGGLEDTTIATVFSRQGATFRTNVGLAEISGQGATARVSVYFATGTQLAAGGANATKDFTLPPHGYLALNGIVRQIVGDSRETDYPDLRGVSVRVEVVSGGGTIVPYVTVTDNGTNDTILRIE